MIITHESFIFTILSIILLNIRMRAYSFGNIFIDTFLLSALPVKTFALLRYWKKYILFIVNKKRK